MGATERLLLLILTLAPAVAHARPTHGEVRPLAATDVVDGVAHYFPPDLGKVWTYRVPGSADHEIRYALESSGTALRTTNHAPMKSFRLVRYAVDTGKAPRELRRDAIRWTDEGVIVVGALRPTDAAALVGERLGVEMPARIAADTTWTAGVMYRVAGLADVSTEAGSWSDCLVVENSGPDATDRRFWCRGVGMTLATSTDRARVWHAVLELVTVASP